MASSVSYQNKHALVIGINKYRRDSLNYCINDATDLASTLRRMNFQISAGINCKHSELYKIVDTFADTVQQNDLVLFYFAGHGKQNEDENFLLPSDYDYDYRGHERDYIVNHAINVEYIMKKIDDRKCRVTIYLFDCCRNLIRTRAQNVNQGLSPMNAPLQTLVVFACAPGKQVQDETRNDRNGSFIENLLKYIAATNRDIEEIMRDVAYDVNSQTAGFQLQYRTSSLTSKVFLMKNDDQESDRVNDFLVLDRACMNPEFDRDFTDMVDTGIRFTRGGFEYRRPYGWKRFAIKVIGKYETDAWLGSSNGPNEWPVSYHGTSLDAAKLITQTGYDLSKGKCFTFGYNIYSTPDMNIAELFAKNFTMNGQIYVVVVQNRVNPKTLIKLSPEETDIGEYWMSPNDRDIRPYGLCVKKIS